MDMVLALRREGRLQESMKRTREAPWQSSVQQRRLGGSRRTPGASRVCRGGLLTMGWCGMRGVHRGVKPGDEARAGGGVNMGKGAASECDGWDGGVQDSRSASCAQGFSAYQSHGSSGKYPCCKMSGRSDHPASTKGRYCSGSKGEAMGLRVYLEKHSGLANHLPRLQENPPKRCTN